MSVTIVPKGGSVELRGKHLVRNAQMGLGWDVNEGQSAHAFDLDASVVARNQAGVAVDACYYGNLQIGSWVRHTGDNLTGEGEGDDEQIIIQLDQIPREVVRLDLVVHIYDAIGRRQSFGMVEGAFVRLVNGETHQEVLRYDLTATDYFDETGILFAVLERTGPTWTFRAVGGSRPEYADLTSFAGTVLPTV